ncbi:phospholipase D-like domain-containing protein [Qipengyuania sp. ASV99]|uniref:phospholipase D-like domain-containing protein n=1 Tax=Qipengyuania sp. ASV99 TaxID=3399681 RepID=UPI003A4C5FA9
MPNNQTPDPSSNQTCDYVDHESFQVSACGHTFTFHPAGADRLAALIEHIAGAERSLDMFYYMFQDDRSGRQVLDALIEAARRGVRVHLIIDDFGSDASAEFFQPLQQAGGQFAIFSASWGVRYLIRNHQKFVIADNARVMTGGSNVSDHYYDPPQDNGWCDLGVGIDGKVAESFTEWFALLANWTRTSGSQFRRVRRMIRQWDPGDGPVQLLLGGPLVRRSHWSYRFKKDLTRAARVDLATAYFGPPLSIRRLLARTAKRGDVRLIAAGKSDLPATIELARMFYRRLLRSGAKVYEFQPCKLHMKLLVLDDKSYFGSANLDRRSIRINIELMVRVEDAALADRLREFLDHLQAASAPVDLQWYRRNTSLLDRMRWRFFYAISLLDYRFARQASR